MILGAGAYQLPAIKRAREMGICTIALSCFPTDPGLGLADRHYNISTMDIARVLEIAAGERIDGIMTIASEASVPTVGYVAERLGLPGIKYTAATTLANKFLFRERCRGAGLYTPRFIKTTSLSEAVEFVNRLNTPSIIKPVMSSGSKGVYKISTASDLAPVFAASCNRSLAEKAVIVEEIMEGKEIGGDCLIYDGKIIFMQPTGKSVNQYLAVAGHSLPPPVSSDDQVRISNLLQNAVDLLEIDTGALNFDIMLTEAGPRIIELGGRLGGNCIPLITKLHTGVDTIEAAIKIALGTRPEIKFNYSSSYLGAKILGSSLDGVIERILDFPEIGLSYEQIVESRIDCKIGNRVAKFNDSSRSYGHVVFRAESIAEFAETWRKLEQLVQIRPGE